MWTDDQSLHRSSRPMTRGDPIRYTPSACGCLREWWVGSHRAQCVVGSDSRTSGSAMRPWWVDNCPVLRRSATRPHTVHRRVDQCRRRLSAHSATKTTAVQTTVVPHLKSHKTLLNTTLKIQRNGFNLYGSTHSNIQTESTSSTISAEHSG